MTSSPPSEAKAAVPIVVESATRSTEDIYTSGDNDINEIFRAYGGNYRIPVFQKN